jgi:hypothetical protein
MLLLLLILSGRRCKIKQLGLVAALSLWSAQSEVHGWCSGLAHAVAMCGVNYVETIERREREREL